MNDSIDEQLKKIKKLISVVWELREKCPWDKKQTMDSLSYLTIEETYELIDAISAQDLNEVKGELGDLLLHIVFYTKIASETNEFDIVDVIHTVCDKLVERHPHIYGDVIAQTEEEVKANWENIKLKKGKKSVLEGVPKSLPAMVKSMRIQEKARGVGFDWEHKDQVFEKVLEEFKELDNEINSGDDKAKVEKEFGDVLFSMINYARFIGVDPELALERTNKKFIGRFTYLESEVKKKQKDLLKMTLAEMDEIWNESKKKFP